MPYQNPYAPQQYQYAQPQYRPSGYMTAGQSYMQQPIHGFVYVTGLEGAKAYQMPPNSEMPLFDSTSDTLFIKTTDGAGFPTIEPCDVLKRGKSDPEQQEYVTRAELDSSYRDLAAQLEQMKEAINGLVPPAAATAAGHAAKPNAGVPSDDGWQSAGNASAVRA